MTTRKESFYLQLGKRAANNRIVKAENYGLETFFFVALARGGVNFKATPKPAKWHFWLGTSKAVAYEQSVYNEKMIMLLNNAFYDGVKGLISDDCVGRKKR